MGDFEDDPIFGSHVRSMRHMNNMMNSFFNDPFGIMGPPALTNGGHRGNGGRYDHLQMMPFGFPPMPSFNMGRLFPNFDNVAPSNGNCHSFMSSSVMTMTSGPDGRPQVYQESTSTRTAPGGVKETKKTVSDSRTGTKKMAIGHHIGDRAHILEREQNYHSGDQEERQEFINLDEEEADTFNKEWETRTRRTVGAIDGVHYGNRSSTHNRSHTEHDQLALPAPTGSSRHSSSRWLPAPRRGIRASSSKPSGVISTSRSRCSTSGTAAVTKAASTSSPTSSGSRKRDHSPDSEPSNKRHSNPNSKD